MIVTVYSRYECLQVRCTIYSVHEWSSASMVIYVKRSDTQFTFIWRIFSRCTSNFLYIYLIKPWIQGIIPHCKWDFSTRALDITATPVGKIYPNSLKATGVSEYNGKQRVITALKQEIYQHCMTRWPPITYLHLSVAYKCFDKIKILNSLLFVERLSNNSL